MTKLCIIYNTAPRYREAIFREIDNEYDCDWFFGETTTDIKEMDVSRLKNVTYYKTYGNPNRLYWQGKMIQCLFNRKYDNYLILTPTRSLSMWCFIFLKSIFFPKKQIYGWRHGFYGREGKIRKLFERLRFKGLTCEFVYNKRARDLMIESGIAADKVAIIYNSLDYETQLSLRKQLASSDIFYNHFSNRNPILCFIGRLTAVKRLDMLLNAVAHLKREGMHLNVVIIGDGEMRAELESECRNLGLTDNIWFFGACYDEKQNAELVYNSDLCVSPGNVGLTAMHSMMFGTPVITNNDFCHQMPEFEAIIKGKTGDFFDNGSVDSLAETIKEWLENHTDRESVRQNCYAEIDSRWNPDNQMRIIKQVIPR